MGAHTQKKEQQTDDLVSALMEISDLPGASSLRKKLSRCQSSRAQRREWGPTDIRRVLSNEWRYHCKSIACPFCRRRILRSIGRREARRFDHTANADCSLLTLADSKTDNLDLVRERIPKITRCIRDLRDYAASRDKRFRAVEVIGYAEIDSVWRDGIDYLAPDQEQIIKKLAELSADERSDSDIMWIVRCHLRVRHVDVSRDEIASTLRRIWPDEQVHLLPFKTDKPASEQAGRYAVTVPSTRIK